jgi:hypothetical protein
MLYVVYFVVAVVCGCVAWSFVVDGDGDGDGALLMTMVVVVVIYLLWRSQDT